jgi:hypothetical protein
MKCNQRVAYTVTQVCCCCLLLLQPPLAAGGHHQVVLLLVVVVVAALLDFPVSVAWRRRMAWRQPVEGHCSHVNTLQLI